MSEQFEHLKNLIIGMITGTLTREEAIELESLKNSDPDFLRIYQDVVNEFPHELIKNNFEVVDQPGFWKDLNDLEGSLAGKRRHKTLVLIRAAAIAAGVTGLLFLGWIFYPDSSKTVPVIVPPSEGIQLHLSNGRQIDLSAVSGAFNEGNATLVSNYNSLRYSVNDKQETGTNSIIVPAGMDYKVSLGDGSEIWLNSSSRLDFPFNFTGATREVKISGEAYLQVAGDKHKPFIVHLPNATVQVTGTGFNVNTYEPGVERVSLMEGSVNMTASDRTVQLKPGVEGVYKRGEDSIISQPFSSRNVLGWREGLYYFDEADLTEINEVLKRWFEVDAVIDDASLLDRKFKGVLNKKEPLATFLNDLQAISKIDYRFDENGILHFK